MSDCVGCKRKGVKESVCCGGWTFGDRNVGAGNKAFCDP